MNKSAFTSFPNFETDQLTIRPFEISDFNDYVSWHDCADIIYRMEGLYNIKVDNQKEFDRFFLYIVPRMFKTKFSGIWCIAKKNTNKNIGLIEVCRFDSYTNVAQIHYCISEVERRKGYMTEAVTCMLDWCFNIVKLNRISTMVTEDNTASSKVLLKCGFKLEGIMRQASVNRYTKNGEEIKETKKDSRFISEKEYRNLCIYAILKNEYKSE